MPAKSKKAVSHSNPESAPEARLLTVKSAAQYLSTTIWCIRNLAWSRSVPHVRLGARILFDRADLDRYVESQKVQAA
ncbi:MAG TPA: helix-turn-helix domain-containing protein [Candidatus Acidoferrales bacterium]|nr:helix-turn-helix domain-containing protein [Candidatus Acidoferrales bacterium]